jgi:hypothetical protein
VLVVMTDVTHELARQVVDRGEDPAGDHIAFDAAEPEFDLIEPRGIGASSAIASPRRPGLPILNFVEGLDDCRGSWLEQFDSPLFFDRGEQRAFAAVSAKGKHSTERSQSRIDRSGIRFRKDALATLS